MHTALKHLPGVQNYLDDIIVYGHSKEEHDEHLQAVLQRLTNVGLQITADPVKVHSGRYIFCSWDMSFQRRACALTQTT